MKALLKKLAAVALLVCLGSGCVSMDDYELELMAECLDKGNEQSRQVCANKIPWKLEQYKERLRTHRSRAIGVVVMDATDYEDLNTGHKTVAELMQDNWPEKRNKTHDEIVEEME